MKYLARRFKTVLNWLFWLGVDWLALWKVDTELSETSSTARNVNLPSKWAVHYFSHFVLSQSQLLQWGGSIPQHLADPAGNGTAPSCSWWDCMVTPKSEFQNYVSPPTKPWIHDNHSGHFGTFSSVCPRVVTLCSNSFNNRFKAKETFDFAESSQWCLQHSSKGTDRVKFLIVPQKSTSCRSVASQDSLSLHGGKCVLSTQLWDALVQEYRERFSLSILSSQWHWSNQCYHSNWEVEPCGTHSRQKSVSLLSVLDSNWEQFRSHFFISQLSQTHLPSCSTQLDWHSILNAAMKSWMKKRYRLATFPVWWNNRKPQQGFVWFSNWKFQSVVSLSVPDKKSMFGWTRMSLKGIWFFLLSISNLCD